MTGTIPTAKNTWPDPAVHTPVGVNVEKLETIAFVPTTANISGGEISMMTRLAPKDDDDPEKANEIERRRTEEYAKEEFSGGVE
ncbi:hypothetical protein YB2330_003870 [Saitoella coloradoensis]